MQLAANRIGARRDERFIACVMRRNRNNAWAWLQLRNDSNHDIAFAIIQIAIYQNRVKNFVLQSLQRRDARLHFDIVRLQKRSDGDARETRVIFDVENIHFGPLVKIIQPNAATIAPSNTPTPSAKQLMRNAPCSVPTI